VFDFAARPYFKLREIHGSQYFPVITFRLNIFTYGVWFLFVEVLINMIGFGMRTAVFVPARPRVAPP
jgi:hypothetical protein